MVDLGLVKEGSRVEFIVEVCPALVRGTEDLLKILLETTGVANKKLLQILAIAKKHTLIQLSDVYQCLEKTCFVGSRAESKFAVMAISCFVDSTEDLTLSNLCQKLVASLQSGQNIPTILQSLSVVAHCSFRTYKPHEKDVTNFIVQKIFNSEKVYSVVEETILTGNLWCSSFCKLKIYGLKALVKTFLPNHPTQVRQEIEELLDILINTIHGNSIVYSNISSDKDKECIRLTAVKLLLLCATRFDSYISQKPFHVIIASARDPSCSVRKAFLHKIHEFLTKNRIPLRYVCAFALASTDCIREVRTDSMKYLSEFIEIHHMYILSQKSSTIESEQVINSPEYAVVFLLHFLAHDQGFSSSSENKELYHELCSPLVIFLRALVNLEPFGGNSRANSETLSNLFAVLLAIKKAEDAVDASITPKLHVLTDIALIILRILGKGLKPSLNKRQMVLLPLSFYKAHRSSLCEGHDLDKSFIDDNFVKGILDVVDSSFIKPCTSNSKQLGRTQTGADHKGNRRDYDFLLNARQGNPSTSISEMQKDIDIHNGDAFDIEVLQEKTRSPQPFKIYSAVASASSGFHNENCDVFGSRNVGLHIPNVILSDQQLSSCDFASAVLHFGPLTSTTEPDAETLNPQLVNQSVTKYESATFCNSKKTLNDDHFMSKNKLVHEGEGLVGKRISRRSPIDKCSYSVTVDSCDSQQNNYKG
ncbi:hypothetical protein HPP92_003205 [Vanilla planifolia]|uniref:Uncharacterized protein n=1 Tax=Vanilla planifolia TaxID=51239 RepID=A0A835RUQ9_VANPL|nr:hypothetical protein HPP92_003205 [Vanilla planifolia]